mgnify:CR=1 FL=1
MGDVPAPEKSIIGGVSCNLKSVFSMISAVSDTEKSGKRGESEDFLKIHLISGRRGGDHPVLARILLYYCV